MTTEHDPSGLPWLAAALLAIDPDGLGGAALRGPSGSGQAPWLERLMQWLPPGAAQRRLPANASDSALLGGLDLTATLRTGRPVPTRGVLAQVHGGVLVVPMAERLGAATVARLVAVMDAGELQVEREGLRCQQPARFVLVALDEGATEDEQLLPALTDRLAFHLNADARDWTEAPDWTREDIDDARERLAQVTVEDDVVRALCATAQGLGIESLRPSLMALRAARACAALMGDTAVEHEHAALAVALVLAPRAMQWPVAPEETAAEEPAENREMRNEGSADAPTPPPAPKEDLSSEPAPSDLPPEPPPTPADAPLADVLLQAARAAIPAGMLAALAAGQLARQRAGRSGRSGAQQSGLRRGRPVGSRRGVPGAGGRLSLIDTLRAAVPWQRLRQRTSEHSASLGTPGPRLQIRADDFHVRRYRQRQQTTTVFVVDASGSAALGRLAEAKGAVELLLAECYVRRDQVAVLAFRGQGAELLLPPTRSLARAKRGLAGLPGGGGTPLAAAIQAASELVGQIRRRGETPVLVWLTDGRANIARDGTPGRAQAVTDALADARALHLQGISTLVLDTSPQTSGTARELAAAMGARYLPLPHADATGMATAVRQAATSGQ